MTSKFYFAFFVILSVYYVLQRSGRDKLHALCLRSWAGRQDRQPYPNTVSQQQTLHSCLLATVKSAVLLTLKNRAAYASGQPSSIVAHYIGTYMY